MAIPEPIETFMLGLGFDYSTLPWRAGRPSADPHAESERIETRVFVADRAPVFAVVADGCRVDVRHLRETIGADELRPATDQELADLYPESEPGMMPPLGPLYGHRVFLDEALTRHAHVVFKAGTRADAIRMRYGDFAELVHPTVGHFAVSPRG